MMRVMFGTGLLISLAYLAEWQYEAYEERARLIEEKEENIARDASMAVIEAHEEEKRKQIE
jgi:hypothetical protein